MTGSPSSAITIIASNGIRPSLVAGSSIAVLGAIPWVDRVIGNGETLTLTAVKLLNLGFYLLSLYAAQRPGRIDGQRQQEQRDGDKIDFYTRRNSLVTPSGWAFAIWGIIFLGELVFVTSSALLVKTNSDVAPLYKQVSGGFIMAQLCQTLWTQAFRPEFFSVSGGGWKSSFMYISSLLLSGISYSLSLAHGHFSSSLLTKKWEYILYFSPMSLHFGWTAAASLVNWNGNLAQQLSHSPRWIAFAGHMSAALATVLGIGVTLTRKDPVFGATIAWALAACSTGMKERLASKDVNNENKKSKEPIVGLWGARIQQWFCGIGAALSAASSIYVMVTASSPTN